MEEENQKEISDVEKRFESLATLLPSLKYFDDVLEDMLRVKGSLEVAHEKLTYGDDRDSVIADEKQALELITILHTLITDALSKYDIGRLLEYSKQMQFVYKNIYTFTSLKIAGNLMLNNYESMRPKNSLRVVKSVAYNNEVINDLRSEMEGINQKLVENQMKIQQELLKQISYAKQKKLMSLNIDPEGAEMAESDEMKEMISLIKENFEMIKGEWDKLNDEREFFKNTVFKTDT